ncbi:transporter [Hymenobacter sp. H14-R3]|uniref:transporter n=1 Tax=Hymenobacter sp. H14-R3 TaxID=3046308 RepID=UPI0024BAF4CF|nr:transporter [Hymenobacter sp. H14-R3]MDJ0366624.1 transporter [Hymenobacter sp. H14-R3]
MRKTTPLVLAILLAGCLTPALAQNTPEESNPNGDTPFVQHIRPDRPGQTITAGVLRAGEFQLETGIQRFTPRLGVGVSSNVNTLRIGFWNSMELRVTQPYVFGTPTLRQPGGETPTLRTDSVGWAPLTVGLKLMLTPDRASRFQASLLAEASLPNTGQNGLRRTTWAPAGRLLLSQQLGRRAALEGNFGFVQSGLTMTDLFNGQIGGQYIGSLALTAPIGNKAGYFVEGYGRGRSELTTGATAGLYYRPWTGLRFDATVGRILGGLNAGANTVGIGMALRLGGNHH